MTLGERIRELRQKAGLTQEELAKEIGYSTKTSISKMENDLLDINQSTIVALARALRTTPSTLMGWEEETKEATNIRGVIPSNNIHMVPVYATVSAGFGAYAEDSVVDYIPMIIENKYDVQDTIGILVKGDSMYPKIEDGDTIVVRKQESVDSGDVAVLLLDGDEGLVKKVVYGSDWIELHSFNPEYKTRRFEGRDVLRLRVVGKVLKVVKSI
nr:MAG TPA: Repressor protein CI [Caudoviricetes sp.]